MIKSIAQNQPVATADSPYLVAEQGGSEESTKEQELMNEDAGQQHNVISAVDKNESQNNDRPTVQFPWRLHELLTEAETNGNDSIISWIPGTKNAFKVHNKEKFTNEILPEYFNATKYKSFQRNLNLWGFESITEGLNKGGCQHRIFIRGDKENCHYMARQKVKGQKQKQQEVLASLSAKDADLRRDSRSFLSAFGGSPSFHSSHAPASLAALDGRELYFCEKLHRFLALPELQACMRWTSDGRCIAIVNPYQFNGIAVNSLFPGMTLPSFLAELEGYGFKKVAHGGFQHCYIHDLIMQGCQHLCKYLATPTEARRFTSEDPSINFQMGGTRNVTSMGTSSSPGLPGDPSSLQQFFQLQHHGGLGNMLPQVPLAQDPHLSSLALLSGQSHPLPISPSLQLLGNAEMQNRSAIAAAYFTNMQLRGGSGGIAAGRGSNDLSGMTLGAQV